MDKTTLIILLISLGAAVVAGIVALYKRHRDPNYIKQIQSQKNKPYVRKRESDESFTGRYLSGVPTVIVLGVIFFLLAKCGVIKK